MRTAPDHEYGHAEGERRKLRALALHGARHSVEVLRARRVLVALVLERGSASIDDVRAELGDLPGRPTWLGAVPTELRDGGIIRRAGYVETDRANAHRRPVSEWELADHDAALRWLKDHPELPARMGRPSGSGPPGNETGSPVAAGEPAEVPLLSGKQTTLPF